MDIKDILKFTENDRLEILFGSVVPPLMPCDKCYKTDCKGLDNCAGFGAYSLCIRMLE